MCTYAFVNIKRMYICMHGCSSGYFDNMVWMRTFPGDCKCGPCVHIDATGAHFDVGAVAVTCVTLAVSGPVVAGAGHAGVGSVAGASISDLFIIIPCDVEYIGLPLLLVPLYTCE